MESYPQTKTYSMYELFKGAQLPHHETSRLVEILEKSKVELGKKMPRGKGLYKVGACCF